MIIQAKLFPHQFSTWTQVSVRWACESQRSISPAPADPSISSQSEQNPAGHEPRNCLAASAAAECAVLYLVLTHCQSVHPEPFIEKSASNKSSPGRGSPCSLTTARCDEVQHHHLQTGSQRNWGGCDVWLNQVMYPDSADRAQGLPVSPLKVTHLTQTTVRGVVVLTERTGSSIATGDDRWSNEKCSGIYLHCVPPHHLKNNLCYKNWATKSQFSF